MQMVLRAWCPAMKHNEPLRMRMSCAPVSGDAPVDRGCSGSRLPLLRCAASAGALAKLCRFAGRRGRAPTLCKTHPGQPHSCTSRPYQSTPRVPRMLTGLRFRCRGGTWGAVGLVQVVLLCGVECALGRPAHAAGAPGSQSRSCFPGSAPICARAFFAGRTGRTSFCFRVTCGPPGSLPGGPDPAPAAPLRRGQAGVGPHSRRATRGQPLQIWGAHVGELPGPAGLSALHAGPGKQRQS